MEIRDVMIRVRVESQGQALERTISSTWRKDLDLKEILGYVIDSIETIDL